MTATGANDADLARTLLKPRAGFTLGTLDVTEDAAVKFFANKHKRVDSLVKLRRDSRPRQGIRDRDFREDFSTSISPAPSGPAWLFARCLRSRTDRSSTSPR
ncbi:hypothetical protein ACIPUD_15305 [Bradyrhizobium sp. CAR08]